MVLLKARPSVRSGWIAGRSQSISQAPFTFNRLSVVVYSKTPK